MHKTMLFGETFEPPHRNASALQIDTHDTSKVLRPQNREWRYRANYCSCHTKRRRTYFDEGNSHSSTRHGCKAGLGWSGKQASKRALEQAHHWYGHRVPKQTALNAREIQTNLRANTSTRSFARLKRILRYTFGQKIGTEFEELNNHFRPFPNHAPVDSEDDPDLHLQPGTSQSQRLQSMDLLPAISSRVPLRNVAKPFRMRILYSPSLSFPRSMIYPMTYRSI